MEQKPQRVLVADDYTNMRLLLVTMLRNLGYHRIDQVSNGAEAVAQFKRSRHDIVLLDLNMPGMDGMQALTEIKAVDPQVFVVIQTGDATAENVRKAAEAGVGGFLAKPYSFDKVRATMARYPAPTAAPG